MLVSTNKLSHFFAKHSYSDIGYGDYRWEAPIMSFNFRGEKDKKISMR